MKVEIYPAAEEYGGKYMQSCIKPASLDLPEWYKKSNSYVGDINDKKFLEKRMTMKKCIPILDFMTTGINLYLPFSIFVYGKYPERSITDNTNHSSVCGLGHHDAGQVQRFPVDESYDPQPLKIDFPYIIKTPKEYSSIYIQPINEYYDSLMFPRALVNTDNYDNQVNFPFFIKKDFEGVIPAGTHFMSVFFVKRDPLEISMNSYEDGKSMIKQARTMVQNWGRHFYKNTRF
jgi:hypothetical protein